MQSAPLPSVQESIMLQETRDNINSSYPRGLTEMANNRSATRTVQKDRSESKDEVRTRNSLNSDHLERCFKTQLSIEEREGNSEKRYKRTLEIPEVANSKTNVDKIEESYNNFAKGSINSEKGSNNQSSETKATGLRGGLLENLGPFTPPSSWSFVSSWQNSSMNSKFQSFRGAKEARFNDSERGYKPPIVKDTIAKVAIDPHAQSNPFHEPNPGPSTYNNIYRCKVDDSACNVHQSSLKNVNKTATEAVSTGQDALEVDKEDNIVKGQGGGRAGKELSQLISKLSFPDDRREEGGLLEWFSKVPGRVLGVTATKGYVDGSKTKISQKQPPEHHHGSNEIKFKNCNLELSQREVDEVLAVLRARTPSGRRRAAMKNVKRRERLERAGEDGTTTEKLPARCASSESTNVAASRVKSYEDCDHKFCNGIDPRLFSRERPIVTLDRVYYDKNVYQPAHSKLVGSNRLNEDSRADVGAPNKDADRLRNNVSTKADVLLGAILRTSKDRKELLDASNGTRPRSTTNNDDDGDDSRASLDKLDQDHHGSVSFNDERSLPLAMKRFNRLRQLFKKEEDRKIAIAEENSSSPEENLRGRSRRLGSSASLRCNNEQNSPNPHNARSKAKRRIDFANCAEAAEKKEEEEATTTGLNAKDAHQKPSMVHSTNIDDRERDSAGLNRGQNHCDRLYEGATERSENEERGKDCAACRDVAVPKNNLITTTTMPNEHSSSKVRNNNNHKDVGVAEDDEETVDRSVPSALDQERFRRSLENAASMVFHSRTGLPLTSSPAPLRRGSCCFDYDSSLNSVSSKRRYYETAIPKATEVSKISITILRESSYPLF